MSEGAFLVVALPVDASAPIAWWRLNAGKLLDRGADLLAIRDASDTQLAAERVVAVVPATAVTVNLAELPGLSSAQARAAARLLAAENSITPAEALHVAVGEADDETDRLIVVTDRAHMTGWLARLQQLGFDPDAVVPASLLLPAPETGFARAEIFGSPVISGEGVAFADEPELTPLITRDAAIEDLESEAIDTMVTASLASLPINMRQGDFARRRRWAIDWKAIRRIAILGAAIAAATLLINFALILKYQFAADALERQTTVLARSVIPDATSDAGALLALEDRLAGLRGGGAGFSATAAAIFAAVRATPNVELTHFDFAGDGTPKVTISAATPADITVFLRKVESYGFSGQATAPQQVAGRSVAELTVKLP